MKHPLRVGIRQLALVVSRGVLLCPCLLTSTPAPTAGLLFGAETLPTAGVCPPEEATCGRDGWSGQETRPQLHCPARIAVSQGPTTTACPCTGAAGAKRKQRWALRPLQQQRRPLTAADAQCRQSTVQSAALHL